MINITVFLCLLFACATAARRLVERAQENQRRQRVCARLTQPAKPQS